MAVSSRARTEFQVPKKFRDRETSPGRTKIWTEQKPMTKTKTKRKVPVIYYLSRDGHLEHPHFMEVAISSSNEGLYLRDVINRLNCLRGKGMGSMYSWSSKRSYKNGFVWHDLSENDFIYPVHGQEYVLKGSEVFEGSAASFKSQETASSSSEKHQQATSNSSEETEFPVTARRRNQSWSSLGLHEYKVYKTESTGEFAAKATDASTQTDEKRRRRRTIREEDHEEDQQQQHKNVSIEEELQQQQQCGGDQTTELSREEISPPHSSSSPETLESLIKADEKFRRIPRKIEESAEIRDQSTDSNHPSGRIKASAVLMQLISCGSLSVKDNGSTSGKDLGFSLTLQYKARLPRGTPNEVEALMENPIFAGIQVDDKEYFSGSLIETKKDEFPALKRSSSYNADRSSKMELKEKEIEGVRTKCIPRMPKTSARKNQV